MRTALISDIHANLEALTSVLADIEKQHVDRIISLGDVIGYGSEPIACLELISKSCQVMLMGNHEYAALGLISTERYNPAAKQASEWTKEQLTDNVLSLIDSFQMSYTENDTLYIHASPYEPESWRYILAPTSAMEGFNHFIEKICFFGHTHVPQIFTERDDALPRCMVGHDFLPDPDSRYLINVGSVGQPRDNDPRACYVIFDDSDEQEVSYQRVEYDIAKAQQKMTEAEIPKPLISRLSAGK